MYKHSKILLLLMLFTLLYVSSVPTVADTQGAAGCKLSNVTFGHTYVSFKLSDVEMAQTAKLIVSEQDSGNKVTELTFSIENSIQEF